MFIPRNFYCDGISRKRISDFESTAAPVLRCVRGLPLWHGVVRVGIVDGFADLVADGHNVGKSVNTATEALEWNVAIRAGTISDPAISYAVVAEYAASSVLGFEDIVSHDVGELVGCELQLGNDRLNLAIKQVDVNSGKVAASSRVELS